MSKIELPEFKIKDRDDIEKSLSHPIVKESVDKYTKFNYSIDVSKAMEDLKTVGTLLSVAVAGSKGYPCSVGIINILSEYQSLVNESLIATDEFVDTSVSALINYSYALSVAKKGSNKHALNLLSKSCEDAEVMEERCGALVELSQSLIRQSKEALVSATNSNYIVVLEKRNNEKIHDEVVLKHDELNIELNRYKEELLKIKTDLDSAQRDARFQEALSQLYKFLNSIISSLQNIPNASFSIEVPSMGYEMIDLNSERIKYDDQLHSEKEELEKKERRLLELKGLVPDNIEEREDIIKLKHDIEKSKKRIERLKEKNNDMFEKYIKDAKGKAAQAKNKVLEYSKLQLDIKEFEKKTAIQIQQSVSRIKKLQDENNHLGSAIQSLDMTISNLGKIETTFKNTQMFWVKVKRECRKLMDKRNLELLCSQIADGDNGLFINEIEQYGLKWLSFASINHKASLKIREVKDTVDGTMSNLPSKEEAKEMIESIYLLSERESTNRIKALCSEEQFIRAQMDNISRI